MVQQGPGGSRLREQTQAAWARGTDPHILQQGRTSTSPTAAQGGLLGPANEEGKDQAAVVPSPLKGNPNTVIFPESRASHDAPASHFIQKNKWVLKARIYINAGTVA